jgi:hypothetical protein
LRGRKAIQDRRVPKGHKVKRETRENKEIREIREIQEKMLLASRPRRKNDVKKPPLG